MTIVAKLFLAAVLGAMAACSPSLLHIDGGAPAPTPRVSEETRDTWERAVSARINEFEHRIEYLEEVCPPPPPTPEDKDVGG